MVARADASIGSLALDAVADARFGCAAMSSSMIADA
jgi:hypothetical protein